MTMNAMQTIRIQIEKAPNGSIFTMNDFYGIAVSNNIKQCLSRLIKEGVLNRISRGIYQKPKYIPIIHRYASADPELVVQALVRENGWSIIPSGNAALNILGLDTQIPTQLVYISSGPNRRYVFGNVSIEFLHRSNKEIGPFSDKTALIIQALKALGPERILDWHIEQIKNQLTDNDKITIRKESRFAFKWMQPFLMRITEGKCNG